MAESDRFRDEFEDFESNGSASTEDMELFEQYLAEEEDIDLPERGDLREGVIVEVRANEILVNIGAKRDGVVPQSDLARLDNDYVDDLQEGETVPVVVSKLTTDEGMLILSIADALQKQDWLTAEKQLESGEITTHKVVGYNKGGILVDYGHLRGFVPASHVVGLPRNLSEEERFARLEAKIGEELPLKVIEVERRRRRLVLSHRLAEREYRAERKEQLFKELKVGDVVQGEVRSLRPFGAFVDIGGADGLLHVSEIGWTPVSHPRDVLKVGDQIQVEILRLDPERSRIALSRKQLLPNPWESIEERYTPNETVLVTITRVVDFGAFAQLEPGVEGLIHISELADIAVAEPLKTVSSGDRVPVKILRVDPDRQRIGLSRRQADEIVGQALLESEVDRIQEAEQDDETGAEEAQEQEAPSAQETQDSQAAVADAETEIDGSGEEESETGAEEAPVPVAASGAADGDEPVAEASADEAVVDDVAVDDVAVDEAAIDEGSVDEGSVDEVFVDQEEERAEPAEAGLEEPIAEERVGSDEG